MSFFSRRSFVSFLETFLSNDNRYLIRQRYKCRLQNQRLNLASLLKDHYKNNGDQEIKEILEYLGKNDVHMLPYRFKEKYSLEDIHVFFDEKVQHSYALIKNNRVYFPKDMDAKNIKESVQIAFWEQSEEKSPHKYLTNKFDIHDNSVAVLIGASDGIFALSIIHKVKKIYLFETDSRWISALQLSLAPWKDKVEIVNTFVSDTDNGDEITLDSYFKDKESTINYIQMDVEGNERKILVGAKNILTQNTDIKVSVCCYHKQFDEKELSDILKNYGFHVFPSYGYMVLWMQLLEPPYLRRGVLYGFKND